MKLHSMIGCFVILFPLLKGPPLLAAEPESGDGCVAGEAKAVYSVKTESIENYMLTSTKGANELKETFTLKNVETSQRYLLRPPA